MNETDLHVAVTSYLDEFKTIFYSGYATEVSYRGIIERFVESLLPEVDAINEPKRVEVGAPDFVLTKRHTNPEQLELVRSVPLGFIEAKDVVAGILDKPENQSQIERYMDLGNVIHTDGLTWRFYFERKLVKEVSLGYVNDNKQLATSTEHIADLEFYLRQTVETTGRTIRTAKSLALHMADRAKPIRRTILSALKQDLSANSRTDLVDQYYAFKETLIHDLSEKDFSDIYAETIAYGLFAARYNDDSLDDFNLAEAAQKVPQTNPFLRRFFLQIAAYERDVRLDWVLNNFADLFRYADVHKIMSTYGKDTGMNHDPVTHFYETFLGEYDPKRRKARGVYYTPRPVVQYIVRAVDKVLQEEFGLADGLADDSKTKLTLNVEGYKKGLGKGSKIYHTKEVEIPRVQILDPATGTSTFLNETIKLIADRKSQRLGSAWNDYVEKNLLPRIHGFEILMAAYSMAHMRLGLTLAESGYKPKPDSPRIGVYLTNSLEEPAQDEPPLLAMMGMGKLLTEEAVAADKVKRDLPIMVVMGNPPYSVSSANKSRYIDEMMREYKKDLNERNIQPLSDDYIKFIRYAESTIEKNGQGIVAMITNNSYIDGLIHRQMRKHLLQTFDKIWVLDLHGNSKKKEVAPDGGKDENVFDIMQGVSIVVMVKTGAKQASELAEVKFAELYGKRTGKYDALNDETKFERLSVQEPRYFFVKKDTALQGEYEKFISVDKLMPVNDVGVSSYRDWYVVDIDREELSARMKEFYSSSESSLLEKYPLKFSQGDSISKRIHSGSFEESKITKTEFRPFDSRYIYYSFDLVDRPRWKNTKHLLKDNLSLVTIRRSRDESKTWNEVLITNSVPTGATTITSLDRNYVAPLYIYHEDGTRTPNFNLAELSALTRHLSGEPSPEDILDYIYAILHSPSYREKYKEFLKIDFPRVPVPTQVDFDRLVPLGRELRELHLMKDVTPGDYHFSGEGDGEVDKLRYDDGKVYINSTQYFENIPETAWNFYIGGYQPAQKWLKDRKGRPLGYEDIEHYQRIIKILLETDRVMKEIG